jgi:uncharacterized membrane protein YvlD (DUF360 family)
VAFLWAIEVIALWVLARILPGLSLEGWGAAALAVGIIGLLNALVRPFVLLLTLPITVLSFGFLTLALNAFILWGVAAMVPGLHVAGFGTGFIAAMTLSVTNTVASALLAFNEEDSVYRNIVRRIARRTHPGPPQKTAGLVFIEIDGLAATTLERAMREGYLPTLQHWLSSGSHRLRRWDCGLPSQTSSVQAGLLFGNNFDIPGFRWYERATKEVIVCNDPAHAMRIEQRVSRGAGLLRDGGISICNMFTGDAEKNVATISTLTPAAQVRRSSSIYFSFFLNPYNFTRALILMVWELFLERWQSLRQRLRGVRPRVSRGGSFPFLRAASTVFQRELGTYTLMSEMFAGVPIAYITYVGYDVVAHHAGPERTDALRILRDVDRRIAMLARAANDAPRPYHFVVLSDHGQAASIPFRQRHGRPVDDVVRELVSKGRTVHAPVVKTEGWGHLNALLSEAIRHDRLTVRAARRLLRRRTREGVVDLGSMREAASGEVLVCASGNLGLIYFTTQAQRLHLEEIASDHPGLIEGLVAHEGIGFVMMRSARYGPVVTGRGGVHYLRDRRIEGDDPLADYGDHAREHLVRLDGFPHCGDLVVMGRYHPGARQVETFEEMVGAHGGLGGAQTVPFLVVPRGWPLPAGAIRNPEHLYQVFVRWRDALAEGREPSARVDGLAGDAV